MHEYEDCKEWLADYHTDVWQEWKALVEGQHKPDPEAFDIHAIGGIEP